jgi:hypothetical protein
MGNVTPKTKEEARAFLRRIYGPPRRQIEGQEYIDLMLLMKMIDPISSSNNQRTMTDEYVLGGKRYHVTYGLSDEPELEEIEDETTT